MQSLFRRLSRWELILLVLLAAFLALWPFEAASAAVLSLRKGLQYAIYTVGAIVLGRVLFRLARALTRRFLWRVRHRMAVVFVFIGAIPLTLAFLLFGYGLIWIFGPLGAFMVSNEVEKRAETLYATADSLAWQLRAADTNQERGEIGRRFRAEAGQNYPDLMIRVETASGRPFADPPGFGADSPPAGFESYRGVVRRHGAFYLAAYAQYEAGAPSLLLMVPLTEQYLVNWLPGLGVVQPSGGFVFLRPPTPPNSPAPPRPVESRGSVATDTLSSFVGPRRGRRLQDMPLQMRLPDPVHPLDWPIRWKAVTPVMDWATGETTQEDIFQFTTRSSAVIDLLFKYQSSEAAINALSAGYVLLGLFAVALVISTVIAVSLTRTITAAINELYVGAKHVSQGDFSHRTPVRGHTQLTELARSFNSMTTSIEGLIEDSRERQKLESELAIANEMQRQLFPKRRPAMPSIDALGVCKPAKVVSGDFYDYVDLDEGRVAIAFGDVAGKGISSALVMAAAHSTIRTQLARLRGEADLEKGVVEIVRETNQQLFEGTAPELYTTLFFAVYDAAVRELVYVNAGHLPPFLIRNGEHSPLEVTGMVVGAFPKIGYESRRIALEVGDLLVAFTDGITEPEDPYGEEFGEDRLWQTLKRDIDRPVDEIITSVMDEVVVWTGGPKQQDDMTMLLMRRLA